MRSPLKDLESDRNRAAGHGPRACLGIGLAYLLLTLVLTHPLAWRLDTHLCGDVGDNYAFLWQLRWFSTALLDLHISPFHTPDLHYPEGASLLLNPTTLCNTALFIPLQRFFSYLTAYNLLVLASFWLSALTAYALVFALTRSRASAFVGGFVYAFSSFHFGHALGHLSTLSIHWIPLFVLYLLQALHTHRMLPTGLACLFLILSALCCWHFLLCGSLLLVWTVLFFSFPWRRSEGLRAVRRGAAILSITLAALSPLLVPMMIEAAKKVSVSGHPPAHYPADLVSFFVPNFTSTFGMLFSQVWMRFRANPIESSVYVGYAVLGFALWGLLRTPLRSLAYWLGTLALFFLLSLGPFLNVLGKELPVPLPYAVLHRLVPYASVAGVPARFHAVSLVCLAVLCGFGVRSALGDLRASPRGTARRVGLAVAAASLFLLLLVEHLHVPMFATEHRVPPFYASLGQDPEAYALVDFTARGKALFCQSVHRKKLVGGYVARGGEGRNTFLKESEIVRHVHSAATAASGGAPEAVGLEARRILEAYDIRYLIFPRPGYGREKALSDSILRSAEAVLKSRGPVGLAGFALKIRCLFAFHPEWLPSNTIGAFVPESERIVTRQWSLPVAYEDEEIRVYSLRSQTERPRP